jgi:hypothetical protein
MQQTAFLYKFFLLLLVAYILLQMMHTKTHKQNDTYNYTILFHSSFCVLNVMSPSRRQNALISEVAGTT